MTLRAPGPHQALETTCQTIATEPDAEAVQVRTNVSQVGSNAGETTPGNERPHDHREYDTDPIQSPEYGVGGGSATSFSSVPGWAVPGRRQLRSSE
jgi:hypothetical protein